MDRFARERGEEAEGREADQSLDDFLDTNHIKWSRNLKRFFKRGKRLVFSEMHIRRAMYRPFTEMYVYFQGHAVDEMGKFLKYFPNIQAESENRVVCVPTVGFRDAWSVMMTDKITDLHFTSGDGTQCFPFYIYDEDGTNRRENITDWALEEFRERYNDETIAKWDLFFYVYGILHDDTYRVKHLEDLKRELPRIPFAEDFWAFSRAGRKLGELHLGYKEVEAWPLENVYTDGVPLSLTVDKMKLNKDKTMLVVNKTHQFTAIPEESFKYRVGKRSPLEWVIDQFQHHEDPLLGIVDDPNRSDDPEHIVKLVERVVRVSLETVEILQELPQV